MNYLQVKAKSQVYPIFFGDSLANILQLHLNNYLTDEVCIVSNEAVANLYLDSVVLQIRSDIKKIATVLLPDGEQYKEFNTINLIYTKLLQENFARSSTLIGLGGGVIGDMTGFVASTYKRGINFIQIPTTLLSQVDSSVGGKTAINHALGKNMIGSFYQPNSVFIGIDVLRSLSSREFCAGLAEVIKYALLADGVFFSWLEKNIGLIMQLDNNALHYAIHKCCQMKAQIVAEDETEKLAKRALLNLGHTFAHAIEVKMGYGNFLHGEAVAVGLVLACKLSQSLGLLEKTDTLRVIELLKKAHLPVAAPKFDFEQWLDIMNRDKKVKDGKINFIVLDAIGHAKITSSVSVEQIKNIIINS